MDLDINSYTKNDLLNILDIQKDIKIHIMIILIEKYG